MSRDSSQPKTPCPRAALTRQIVNSRTIAATSGIALHLQAAASPEEQAGQRDPPAIAPVRLDRPRGHPEAKQKKGDEEDVEHRHPRHHEQKLPKQCEPARQGPRPDAAQRPARSHHQREKADGTEQCAHRPPAERRIAEQADREADQFLAQQRMFDVDRMIERIDRQGGRNVETLVEIELCRIADPPEEQEQAKQRDRRRRAQPGQPRCPVRFLLVHAFPHHACCCVSMTGRRHAGRALDHAPLPTSLFPSRGPIVVGNVQRRSLRLRSVHQFRYL